MPRSTTIRTIGDFLDYEHRLSACCNNIRCRRYVELDLEALAGRQGRDFDTNGIRRRLRCTACGSRDCGLQVRPPAPDPGCFRPRAATTPAG